jgi:hypothetical protein
MPGKPFQSQLEPHFDFILESRRKHQTWQAIAHELADKGITVTPQAVHGFTKRRLKRRYPLGAAPADASPAPLPPRQPSETSSSELPEFTESLPPSSDFTADPLTLPPMGKKKSKWTVLKPNP